MKKALVIQIKMLGDVLTSSILCTRLVEEGYIVDFLTNKGGLFILQNNPSVNKTILFDTDKKKHLRDYKLFGEHLRKEKYDLIVDAYSKIGTARLTKSAQAKKSVGIYKWYLNWAYDKTVRNSKVPITNAGLAIENRMSMLNTLNIPFTNSIKPKIYLNNSELLSAKKLLVSNNIDSNKPLFMISVMGSNTSKSLPVKEMAKMIDFISNYSNKCQIIFNYMPNQLNDALAIKNNCNKITQNKIFFDVMGKGLREFMALTAHCTALIGNEGGAVNMAKALDIPTFTIFCPWIKKETWSLFENGDTNVSVHLKDYKPTLFKNKETKELKKNWKTLYKSFDTKLFNEELKFFLNNRLSQFS